MEQIMSNPAKPGLLQRGATLLEAMVGILIFSLGILALVGMQALAIKQVTDAKYRADASFFANQIIGELWVKRTDPNFVVNHNYTGTGAPPNSLENWVVSIEKGLPGVTAGANRPTVTVVGAPNNWTVTVTVFWQPPAATTPHNHVTIAYING
jgi:type IV pilus assembly protein PilV